MTAALLAALAVLLSQCGSQSAEKNFAQHSPNGFAILFDSTWHWTARNRLTLAENKRELIQERLTQELAEIEGAPSLVIPEETETLSHGTYGVLPEVYVDKNYGQKFPKPIASPERISWYGSLLEIEIFLNLLEDFEKLLRGWHDLPDKKRLELYSEVEGAWTLVNSRISDLAARVRYLETWIPRMKNRENQPPISQLFVLALRSDGDSAEQAQIWEQLRDLLRPHRVLQRPFLPEKLSPGTYKLPLVTDLKDKRFLSEVEGAIEVHWNESPWARRHAVRFRIVWIKTPPNQAFKDGLVTLGEHIETFPEDKIAMTTGGDTSFVRDNVFVLSPGKITPRTIAHEFGHLLGFEDCYFRTVRSQGLRGLEILEWSNPIYPDDLMCDNGEGVARSNVW